LEKGKNPYRNMGRKRPPSEKKKMESLQQGERNWGVLVLTKEADGKGKADRGKRSYLTSWNPAKEENLLGGQYSREHKAASLPEKGLEGGVKGADGSREEKQLSS